MGEMIKYGALSGDIFELLKENTDKWTDLAFLTELICDCITHKARVVERDEKETGERKSLNVGHTTGHAIELAYGFSHGEGVLYGMLFETQIAIEQGVCEKEYGETLLSIVRAALALVPQASVDFSTIAQAAEKARLDKKNTSDGEIKMSVAKSKGVWTTLSLPFADYQAALIKAAQE